MAKITGPLMSVSARGRIAGSLIFRETKGIPVIQKFTKVHDRKSPAQLAHRAFFRGIVAAWKTHTPQEKATLEPKVKGLPLTTYDYYIKKFFETGEDPLGPPPVLTNIMVTTITNLFIPTTIMTPPEQIEIGFGSIPSMTWIASILDPTNEFMFGQNPPTQEILGTILNLWEHTVPAGYTVYISTDILTNFPIYYPEATGWIMLYPATDGSTYYDIELTQLAQAAP